MKRRLLKKVICLTLAASLLVTPEASWAAVDTEQELDFDFDIPEVDKKSPEYKAEQKVEDYLKQEIYNDSDDLEKESMEAMEELNYNADDELDDLAICEDETPGESKEEPGSETETPSEEETEEETETETPSDKPKDTEYYKLDPTDKTGHTFIVINQEYDKEGKLVDHSEEANYHFDITTNLNKALRAADKYAKLDSKKADGPGGNDAWDDQSIYTVVVPAGSYYIKKTIRLYHNTVLDMTGKKNLDGSANDAADTSVVMSINPSVYVNSSGAKVAHNFNMIILGTTGTYDNNKYYNVSSKVSEYNGFKNITIKGGTWIGEQYTSLNSSLILRMTHAKNITIDGASFKYGGGKHQLEFSAIDGLNITNCKFSDYNQAGNTVTGRRESIQLDVVCSKSQYPSSFADGTPMKNVTVKDCEFTDVPRGLGGHTILTGCYFDNFNILNNTFTNVYEEAVVALNWINSTISGNTMTNCGGGVLYQPYNYQAGNTYTSCQSNRNYYLPEYRDVNGNAHTNDEFILPSNSTNTKTVFDQPYFIDYKTEMNVNITDNTISTSYKPGTTRELQAIKVWGNDCTTTTYKGIDGIDTPQRNYCAAKINISGNVITSAGYGIHLRDVQDSSLVNNTIKQAQVNAYDANKSYYDGIYIVAASKNIQLNSNVISDFVDCGIYVGDNSAEVTATYNTISGVLHGIMNATAASSNTYTYNVISDTKNLGIYIKASTAYEVSNNTLTNIGTTGVYVYSNATVTTIANNTITNTATNGIYINSSSLVVRVEGNYLENIGTNGIYLYNGSGVIADIKANKICSPKVSGIRISGSSCAEVAENAVENASGEFGILVYSSNVTSVSSNRILIGGKGKDGYCPGIKLSTNSKCDNISGNYISSQDENNKFLGYGIYVYKNCEINGSINNNTITNPHGDAMYIANSSSTNEIKLIENKLVGNGTACGIYLKSGFVNISKNKISKVISGICIAAKMSGTISGNNKYSSVKRKIYVAATKGYTVSNSAVKIKKVSANMTQASVSWKKLKDFDNYEIQVAKDKSFKKSLKKYTAKGTATSKTIKKLKRKNTYYVRIRAVKKCNGITVYGKFSSTKKFKTH